MKKKRCIECRYLVTQEEFGPEVGHEDWCCWTINDEDEPEQSTLATCDADLARARTAREWRERGVPLPDWMPDDKLLEDAVLDAFGVVWFREVRP